MAHSHFSLGKYWQLKPADIDHKMLYFALRVQTMDRGGPGTLTDPTLSCPEPLLKTTPPPPGYPWVSGGWYVTPEPRFRGLVLDHQLLKEPEPKNHSKRAKFDQK